MEATTLERLAGDIGAAPPPGSAGLRIDGVSTDTRTIRPGEAFFAIRGERFDGTRFVEQAFARGARVAVVPSAAPDLGPGRPLLRVPCVTSALLDLGRAYRARLGFRVVAITGSAGKTTTKDLLFHMVQGSLSAVRAPRSFNNHIGVPLTLLDADRATDVVLLEVGTSGPGEIDRLGAVARPDVAVITCIAPAHLEGLGSIEGVTREKLSLLRHIETGGAAVLNGDDLRLRGAGSAYATVFGDEAVTLCGFAQGAEVVGEVVAQGARWQVAVRRAREVLGTLELKVPGRQHALDALLALGAALRLGVPAAAAIAGLRSYVPAPGRLDVRRAGEVLLVDDTYNANPASVGAALEAFAGLAPPERRVVVLGDMRELGRDSVRLHREVGRLVARTGVARLVTVGREAAAVAGGAREAGLALARVVEVPTADEVLPALEGHLAPGTAVLFKGSRACRLEEAVAAVREVVAPAPRRRAA